MFRFIEKITDALMPIEEEEMLVDTEAEKKNEYISSTRKVANGSDISYAAEVPSARSKLTVYTTKVPDLKILVYVPENFDQVMVVADALKQKQAAIINYERVDFAEQRRICDFINGVCYIVDGEAKRVSDMMVLYVPAGVSVSTLSCKADKK